MQEVGCLGRFVPDTEASSDEVKRTKTNSGFERTTSMGIEYEQHKEKQALSMSYEEWLRKTSRWATEYVRQGSELQKVLCASQNVELNSGPTGAAGDKVTYWAFTCDVCVYVR